MARLESLSFVHAPPMMIPYKNRAESLRYIILQVVLLSRLGTLRRFESILP